MRRKIYYKKKFYSGLSCLLLGLALPGVCLVRGWERFDLKDGVLTVLLLLCGLSGILRSLDRETARQDRDEDRDERRRYNEERSRAVTFRVVYGVNFAILAGCLLGYGLTEEQAYIQTGLPCMVLFILGWLSRIVSELYYEWRG